MQDDPRPARCQQRRQRGDGTDSVVSRNAASSRRYPCQMTGVSLRPIVLDDWPRVHEWASTEAACRHQPWGPNDEADTRQFVVDALAAWTNTASTRRVWAAQTPTHGVIGLGELKIRSMTHRQAEISYAVHTDLWGQGYGEDIARALVEVGRAEGMHRIAATRDRATALRRAFSRRSECRTRAGCATPCTFWMGGETLTSMRWSSTRRRRSLRATTGEATTGAT
jgi:ribosomal-protein-alanine N-acetyltransferase